MSDVIDTVGQFFEVPASGLTPVQIKLLDGSAEIAAARKALAIAPQALRDGIAHSVSAALRSALAIPLSDVFASAWGTRQQLLEYLKTEKHPPEEVAEVPLLEHEIKSRHGPVVQLLLSGERLCEVRFSVALSVSVESAVLRIQGGKIIAASAGSCTGKGSLCCGDAVLVERATHKFSLPAGMTFVPGLPIGALEFGRRPSLPTGDRGHWYPPSGVP